MTIDVDHAIFVRTEFRYATATDSAVKAKNPMATETSINTNLSESDAEALADNYLAANDNPRYFEIEVEGIFVLSNFVGGPPSFILDFPKFQTDGRTMTVVSVSADFNTGYSTIGVRG